MTHQKKRGRPRHEDILTPAEWRTIEGLRHGMTNRQIAERRGISIDAVKYHVANILQKLCLSNRAELRVWNGVAANSTLHTEGDDVSTEFKIKQVGQISRHTKDINQAREWYEQTLGLEHLFSFGDISFFNCNGVRLFLNQSEGELPPDSIIYFQVDNIKTAKNDMEARGIIFTNAPHMVHKHDDGTEEWMAFFNDVDDRPLAIMAQHKPVD